MLDLYLEASWQIENIKHIATFANSFDQDKSAIKLDAKHISKTQLYNKIFPLLKY